ncbi:MAG: type II toxin-antitoxin system Phd/YefM family antitoxin [Flexilinea sp.]|nr:type II toxin-antitoxin system Phd/YefM family antitoxin [Flexilinea sp.]
MQIIPMRDLKNTVEIERRCKESHEPVFVTKNGYGSLVVMDIDYYDETMWKMEEARMLNEAIRDYENGQMVDGPTAMRKIREKFSSIPPLT